MFGYSVYYPKDRAQDSLHIAYGATTAEDRQLSGHTNYLLIAPDTNTAKVSFRLNESTGGTDPVDTTGDASNGSLALVPGSFLHLTVDFRLRNYYLRVLSQAAGVLLVFGFDPGNPQAVMHQ
jgi:hypothetical protein